MAKMIKKTLLLLIMTCFFVQNAGISYALRPMAYKVHTTQDVSSRPNSRTLEIAAFYAGVDPEQEIWTPTAGLYGRVFQNKNTGRIKFQGVGPMIDIEFELWLIRHGQTEGNKTEGMFQGALNKPINQLNKKGKEQAELAAEKLLEALKSRGDLNKLVVITSPLGRAKDTADPFIKLARDNGANIEHVTDMRLMKLMREISFGIWDNKIANDLDAEQIRLVNRYRKGLDATLKAKGADSFLDVVMRQKELLLLLNKLYKGKRVILVGHGTSFSALRVVLGDLSLCDNKQQIDWRGNMLPNAEPVFYNKETGTCEWHGSKAGMLREEASAQTKDNVLKQPPETIKSSSAGYAEPEKIVDAFITKCETIQQKLQELIFNADVLTLDLASKIKAKQLEIGGAVDECNASLKALDKEKYDADKMNTLQNIIADVIINKTCAFDGPIFFVQSGDSVDYSDLKDRAQALFEQIGAFRLVLDANQLDQIAKYWRASHLNISALLPLESNDSSSARPMLSTPTPMILTAINSAA